MSIDEIVAMATAVIAEERGAEVHKVKVVSFKEIHQDLEDTNEHLSNKDE